MKCIQFIIGRRGYDNWLVQHALRNNVSVIDATKTLVALHQTGTDGNYAGHNHPDKDYNMKILGPFDPSLG